MVRQSNRIFARNICASILRVPFDPDVVSPTPKYYERQLITRYNNFRARCIESTTKRIGRETCPNATRILFPNFFVLSLVFRRDTKDGRNIVLFTNSWEIVRLVSHTLAKIQRLHNVHKETRNSLGLGDF